MVVRRLRNLLVDQRSASKRLPKMNCKPNWRRPEVFLNPLSKKPYITLCVAGYDEPAQQIEWPASQDGTCCWVCGASTASRKVNLIVSVSNYVVNQLGLEYVVTIRMIIGFRLAIYSRVSMLLVMQQLLIRPLQHLRDPWPTRSSLIPKTSPGRPRRSTPIRPRSRKRKQARRDPVVSPRKSPRRPPRQSRRRPPRQSRRKLPRQSQTTTSFRRTRVVTNCMCASCACVIHMLHVRFHTNPCILFCFHAGHRPSF